MRYLRFRRVLGLPLTLGGSHVVEFLLAHGLVHGLGRALELAHRGVAALGGQSRASGLLLCSGFGWHDRSSCLNTVTSTLYRRGPFPLGLTRLSVSYTHLRAHETRHD